MDSINLNGVSFRWSDGQLLITTAHGQDCLSATSAAQLLDFLQLHQQEMYAGEQGRELPPWARDDQRYVSGTIEHPRLEERVRLTFLHMPLSDLNTSFCQPKTDTLSYPPSLSLPVGALPTTTRAVPFGSVSLQVE